MGKVYLKDYYDLLMTRNEIEIGKYAELSKSLQEVAFDYEKRLVKQGWIDAPIEGGVISPNYAAIFVSNRDPYKGQLLQYRPNDEKYNAVLQELLKSGDFVVIE